MAVSDKLQSILDSKAAIKAAIEAKGVTDVGDVLSTYADKIASIQTGGGGTTSLLRQARVLGDADYIGSLSASSVDIVVGSKLNKPTLYLDGTRMDSTTYSVELNLGKITLNEAYADYDVTWVVEDEFPSHIRFSYPTLSLLQADEQIKSIINVGDVIEILGESDADDGGQRLVKCSNELGLNGVDIGDGKYLNEIPNSKPSNKVDKSSVTEELTIVDEGTVLDGRVGKTLNDRILGGQGVPSIIYIQDEGQKTAGNGYVDKVTGKLYLCKNSTSDTDVTSNFSLATNIENSSRLDNLWKCKTYYAAFGAGQSSLEIPLNIDESFKIHSITSTLNSNDGNIGPNSQVYLISGNKLKVILFLAENIYTVKISAGFMIAVWYSIEN